MKKFWLVWSPQGGTPTVQHPSYETACREAKRLATVNSHPAKTFIVLEATDAFNVPNPVVQTKLVSNNPCREQYQF